MRRAISLLCVLIIPACFNLPKADVIRLVDDFAQDADLQPTWSAFDPWTCSSYVDPGQTSDAGQDAGLDGGADAGPGGLGGFADGQTGSCNLSLVPGDTSDDMALRLGVTKAMEATFDLTAPASATALAEVEVATRTKSAMDNGATDALLPSTPVDLTAFSELIFSATLLPVAAPLPSGTELRVELHCSYSAMNDAHVDDPLVYQKMVALTAGVRTFQRSALALSQFTGASQHQTCLANVDRIGFVVVLGVAQPGTPIRGTLQLDNIRFDNAAPP